MTNLKTMLLAAVAVIGMSMSANAQVNTQDFKHSQWDTSYDAPNGQVVGATVVFDGAQGYYEIPGARGDLFDITYQFTERDGNYTVTVNGRWTLGSSEGTFRFVSSSFLNPQQLSGSWRMPGHPDRRWAGTFNSVLQPVNQNDFVPQDPPRGGTYSEWIDHPSKPYHYRFCNLPAGGKQYLICYDDNPNWVYWFNPVSNVFWCACPTVNHPQYGCQIRNGGDLFLMASNKAASINDTQFPDPGLNGANFKTSATVTDSNGSKVTLNDPPTDLP